MGKYFGTDGFRGEANKTLDYEHAIIFYLLSARVSVVITRRLSPAII